MNVKKDVVQNFEYRQLKSSRPKMPPVRIPKKVMEWTPEDIRIRGPPKCSWMQGIIRAVSERNFNDVWLPDE